MKKLTVLLMGVIQSTLATKPIKMQINQHNSMIVVQVGLRLVIIKGQSNMCSLMLNLLGTGLWASREYRLQVYFLVTDNTSNRRLRDFARGFLIGWQEPQS